METFTHFVAKPEVSFTKVASNPTQILPSHSRDFLCPRGAEPHAKATQVAEGTRGMPGEQGGVQGVPRMLIPARQSLARGRASIIGTVGSAALSVVSCLIALAAGSGEELLGGLISAFTIFLSGK